MFVNRDWSRTEHDDYVLNIEPRLCETNESVEVYTDDGKVIGWKIQTRYE